MSVHAINEVWEFSRSKGNTRLVLLALADNADRDSGEAWPSVEDLARRANTDRRTVQRALRSLELAGEIACVYRGGGERRPARYRVCPSRGVNLPPRQDAAPKGRHLAAAAPRETAAICRETASHTPPEPTAAYVPTSSADAEEVGQGSKEKRTTAPLQVQLDERALEKLDDELKPFVDPVRERLVEIAESKPGAIEPTIAAVANAIRDFPGRDFIPLVAAYRHWAVDGRGRGNKVKDVVRQWREWIRRESDVRKKTPPPGVGSPAADARHRALTVDTRERLEAADR